MQHHCIRYQITQGSRHTNVRYLEILQRYLPAVLNIRPERLSLIHSDELDLQLLAFPRLDIESLSLLFPFCLQCLLILLLILQVLLLNSLLNGDSADLYLAVANKAARFALACLPEIGALVELALEILVAVDHALVLPRPPLMRLEIPLNSDPIIISCFWIIEYLANVANGPHQLHVLGCGVLVEHVLLGIGVFDTDTLP